METQPSAEGLIVDRKLERSPQSKQLLQKQLSECCENRATHSTVAQQHVGNAATLQNGGQETPTYIIIPEGYKTGSVVPQLYQLVEQQSEEVDTNASVITSSPVQQRQVVNVDHAKPKVTIVGHQTSQHPKLIQNKSAVVGKTTTTSKVQLSRTATPLTKVVRQLKPGSKKPLIKIDIKKPLSQIKRPSSSGHQQIFAKVPKVSDDLLLTPVNTSLTDDSLVNSMLVQNMSTNLPNILDNAHYLDEDFLGLSGKLDFLDENFLNPQGDQDSIGEDLFKQEPYSPFTDSLSSPLSDATSNDSGIQDLFVSTSEHPFFQPLLN